jgi:membrane associated rhomboid family serine protease
MPDRKSFLDALFDLSFDDFVLPRIVKLLYVLGVAVALLYGLGMWGTLAYNEGIPGFVAGAVLGPLLAAAGILVARVYLELLIVIFRIAEDLSAVAEALGRESGGAGPAL